MGLPEGSPVQQKPADTARTGAGPASGEKTALENGSGQDSFRHTEVLSEEEEYLVPGYKAADSASALLPARYYGKEICGNVYYKGGTISYRELLEEAVRTGQYELDETKSMWHNVHEAERILIMDHAAPLYPWSSRLYSEDGQYVYRVEHGEITGATRAFYYDSDGRKITTQYLAEQLAMGVYPADLDGDWRFLSQTDSELYEAALKIGEAVQSMQGSIGQEEAGRVHLADPEDDLFLPAILLLGRKAPITPEEFRKILHSGGLGRQLLENFSGNRAAPAGPNVRTGS